jgi:hypothetical protein
VDVRLAVMNSDKNAEVAVAEMRCCSYTEIVAGAQTCLEVEVEAEAEVEAVADSDLIPACSRMKLGKSHTTNTLVVETCL